MAYSAEQDRIRALLPAGASSLRPVLRINAEIWDDAHGCVEFKTAVEKNGLRGWLNIARWTDVPFERRGRTTVFRTEFLEISFTGMGVEGGCRRKRTTRAAGFPARPKRCARRRRLRRARNSAAASFNGASPARTRTAQALARPFRAVPEDVKTVYPKQPLTAPNAAAIPCAQVLGTCRVTFERQM